MSERYECCGEDFDLAVYECEGRLVLDGKTDDGTATVRMSVHQARDLAAWIIATTRPRTCPMIAKLDAWIETKRMGYDPAVVRIYPADHPAQRAFMAATCDQLYHRHDRWQVVTRNEPGDNRMDPA